MHHKVYRYIEDAQQLRSHATNNELSPCSARRASKGQHADKVETTAQKIDAKKGRLGHACSHVGDSFFLGDSYK